MFPLQNSCIICTSKTVADCILGKGITDTGLADWCRERRVHGAIVHGV